MIVLSSSNRSCFLKILKMLLGTKKTLSWFGYSVHSLGSFATEKVIFVARIRSSCAFPENFANNVKTFFFITF